MYRIESPTSRKCNLGAASTALLVGLVLLFFSHKTESAPYNGTTHSFVQPDGSMITLRLFGDEHYLRAETPDGYTVVRDEETGWISYAVYDENEEALVSTGIPFEYTTRTNRDLPWMVGEKHQRLPLEILVRKVNLNHQLIFPGSTQTSAIKYIDGFPEASPPPPLLPPAPIGKVNGEIISLTVVVDFKDAPAPLPLRSYEAYFNDLDWKKDGNSMSIRRYYRQVSYGKVDLKNIVRGIYRAKKTFAEYDRMPYAAGAREILKDVLDQLDEEGFDFSQLTTVGGKIQALNFMFTGRPKAWAKGMWFHQGWLNYSADGVKTGKYACGSANSPLSIGTAIHENGHMVGNWPDTYNYEGGTEPIGNFCIMGSSGRTPPPPNPAFRTMAGWSNVVDITGRDGVWQSKANDNKIYKYRKSGSSTEYYLIESRKKDDWLHKKIPDEGLTIWHVDTNGKQQDLNHLMVELMHGDDDWKDKNDACFHAGGADKFNDRTIPNSKWWSGANSGLDIHSISSAGTTMSFTTGRSDNHDQCPSDPKKTEPGECGCGTPDTDRDNDRTPDCKDNCPTDPNKTQAGKCGCGRAEGTCGGDCVDKNTSCSYWASVGECHKNPGYMLPNCCASCKGAGTDNDGDGGGSTKCSFVMEGATAKLSCAAGETINNIEFASYGRPGGSCDTGFKIGTCHSSKSLRKVNASCLNRQSCSVGVNNTNFDDPCPGKRKGLAVLYSCTGGNKDQCPADPNKTKPGICGCGVPEGLCDGDELYEAEDFTAKNGARLASNNGGFSGDGYMDYGARGTWIEWENVYVSQPGKYTLFFRYAVGSTDHRQTRAIINGVAQGNIRFKNTGSWRSWKTDSVVVTLKKGDNKIRIKANTNNGGPNLDKMTIAFGDNAQEPRSAQSASHEPVDESVTCSVSPGAGTRNGSWLMTLLRLLF